MVVFIIVNTLKISREKLFNIMDNIKIKDNRGKSSLCSCSFITQDVIRKLVERCVNKDASIKNYTILTASDKMLGFLSDYFKLQVQVNTGDNKNTLLYFFVKAISKSNEAKATMVNDMNLFEKEITFYTVIKNKLKSPGINRWSPNLVLSLKEAMIFEDLCFLQYKTRNKFKTFDKEHTLLALETLARFHAASINYEEKKRNSLGESYCINDEHNDNLNEGGYRESDPWFTQCMNGALEAVKLFSKYSADKKCLSLIEDRWRDIWNKALHLADFSSRYRNVICHRDLWNNNILFRYKKLGTEVVPDDCLLVDFQAVRCQPPAGDVMLLLYCNLKPKFREENMSIFINHYYNEMKNILGRNGILIENILTIEDFLKSCAEQRLWGLVVSACLVPQFWIDDELNTKIFSVTSNFQEIMTKDKASFIKKMMEESTDYKDKVIPILEEIVEQYCL